MSYNKRVGSTFFIYKSKYKEKQCVIWPLYSHAYWKALMPSYGNHTNNLKFSLSTVDTLAWSYWLKLTLLFMHNLSYRKFSMICLKGEEAFFWFGSNFLKVLRFRKCSFFKHANYLCLPSFSGVICGFFAASYHECFILSFQARAIAVFIMTFHLIFLWFCAAN